MTNGFIDWFIAYKIGGIKTELVIPFDENTNLISGGDGQIKYLFHDLWKVIDTRIDSKYIYEYIEFREKREDAIKNDIDERKQENNFRKSLIKMEVNRIQINRNIITNFIESVDERTVLKMAQDGKPYTTYLKDYLNEMFIVTEQAMLRNPPVSVYDGLTNAASNTEGKIRRLEWKKESPYVAVSDGSLKEVKEGIKVFSIVLDFWTLLRREYTTALQTTRQVESLTDATANNQSDTVNVFNDMPLEEVSQYFRRLATEKSRNGKSFLSPKQVDQFIERAFLGKSELPKLTLNQQREGQFIWSLFYKYYLLCTGNYDYDQTKLCKDKYIDLLSENFTNFTRKKIADNFHKDATRKWLTTK